MAKLKRDGVELYYEVHGEGPVILLSHGYSATSQMWRGQIEALTKHHKLVTWDMRGHGQSDYPDDPAAYSEPATVADMAAVLDAVGAETAIVGGLSLGGYMSLAFNRVHPERVRALLIIDTGPGYRNDEARAGWNATAHKTAERYARDGLGGLEAGTPEMRMSHHRSADGLVKAARGMLTQRDPGGDRFPADHRCSRHGAGRGQRHPVPGRQRLHGRQDPRRGQGGHPGRRPRGQHRPARGLQPRGAGLPGGGKAGRVSA